MERQTNEARHVLSSSDIFASADTAYVLAYSVIMLTTDLHSKNVRRVLLSSSGHVHSHWFLVVKCR